MGAKPTKTRGDLKTNKSNPQKTNSKQRSERYLKYKQYLKSKQFKAVKKLCEERDNHKCAVCGRTRQDGINLTCHHTSYKHLYEGGETEANDCITLCTICHKAIHASKKNYTWFSMINPRNIEDNTDNNDISNI